MLLENNKLLVTCVLSFYQSFPTLSSAKPVVLATCILLQEVTSACITSSRFKMQNLATALERILFSSLVLAFHQGVLGSNPAGSRVSARHLFICFFVTDFVQKNIMSAYPLNSGKSLFFLPSQNLI